MQTKEILADITQRAAKAGATQSEVFFYRTDKLKVGVQADQPIELTQTSEQGLALRVMVNANLALVATNDFSPDSIASLISKGISLAKSSESYIGFKLPEKLIPYKDLKIFDEALLKVTPEQRVTLVRRAEQYALSFSQLIKASGGAWYMDELEEIALANAKGQFTTSTSSRCQFGISVVAQQGTASQESEASCCRRFFSELETPELVGRRAAVQALMLLGGKPAPTGEYPVIFDATQAAPTFWEHIVMTHFLGMPEAQPSNFLTGKMNAQIASKLITLIDNPSMLKGLCSNPFDAEGNETSSISLIDKGVFKGLLFDSLAAFKNRVKPTGSARRLTYDLPPISSPSNLYLQAGETNADSIIKTITDGLFLTQIDRLSINPSTGVITIIGRGRWIQKGVVTYPVTEVILSDSVSDCLKKIDAVCDNLTFNNYHDYRSVNSPTFKVTSMTIS